MKTRPKRTILRVPTWLTGAAKRSFVFALLLALLWTWSDRAFALDVDAQKPPPVVPAYHAVEALNPQVGSAVPFTLVDEQPDPRAATAQAASKIWGSQLSFGLNVKSSLTSSVYFSKSLPLYEALRNQNVFGYADSEPGFLALRGPGAEHVLNSGRAVQQKLTYSTATLQFQGSYTDVDAAFSMPGAGSVSVIGDRSPVDALAALRGMKDLQFQAQYQPFSALKLNSSQRRSANEQPGNQQIGMTVNEIAHGLVYQLGGNRQFKADYQSREEDWRGHGPMSMSKLAAHLDATNRLALDYSYDSNDIERDGHKEKGRDVTEIKESLVYKLSGDNQLALSFRKFDEQWAGKGPMKIESLAASLKPSSRMQLTYSHDVTANNREGSNEKGLTRDDTKQGLVLQLTKRTGLDINYQQLRDEWNRGGTVDVTEKSIRDYALHHAFGGATKVDLVHNLTTVTSNGTTTDIDTTQFHFERKAGGGLNLVADWLDRNRSDGGGENLMSLALDSAIGSGRGKTALTGLYKQHSEGTGAKQTDTMYQLGLKTAPSRLLQLKANYESLNQQGPTADHAFVRTDLGLVSQLNRFSKLSAGFARETDKGTLTKGDSGARIELNPGWLTLNASMALQERQGEQDVTNASGDLKIKFGRALKDWAKALSAAEPIPGAGGYGFRGAPGWAALGDGAITLNYINRSTDGQPSVVTHSLGYQTMIARWAYVKLAMHSNPMVPKDNKMVMTPVRWDTYEGGLNLSPGFAALGRVIREEDLNNGSTAQSRVLGLRGAVGRRDMFSFIAGLQTSQPEGGSATDWQFANMNLRLGRPLADWAKAASNVGVFDDDVKYGYRQLPAWASFADGGLSLQYMSRDTQDGAKLIASAAGYQTMLGKRTYARLSLQQNPLNDKAQVIAVDRKLYEVGRRIGGKFMALARYISEDNSAESKSLRSSMLGFRGRLSEHERLETVIVVDSTTSQGQRYSGTTYGLEYAREVGDGHYLILKGTYSNNDTPGAATSPESYQIDFAYKKDI